MEYRHILDGDRSRIGWWLLTIVLGAILAFVIYAYLGAFVLGVFVYYATRPIYERYEDWIPSRTIGVFIALLTISLPVLILVGYTIFTIILSLQNYGIISNADFGTYWSLIEPYLDLPGVESPQELFSYLINNPKQIGAIITPGTIERILDSVGTYLAVLASGLLQVLIALVVAFYLLRDDYKLAGWARKALGRNDETLVAYGHAVDQDLKTIYFGNILNAFVVAIASLILYNVLNLIAPTGFAIPVPTLLAMLTGAASLIPVVGMKIIYVPVALYLAISTVIKNPRLLWFSIVFLVASASLIDGLTELILRPYISGRNLHVGLVLFAYILGPLLFGWYGLFLGPLLLVLIVHLARIVLPELVHGEPLSPDAVGADPIPDADPIDEEETANEDCTGEQTEANGEDTTDDTTRDTTDDTTDEQSSST